ncbi:hypothetical protein [Siminovitchia fordii]|uniref:Uncharacterized protein n=1 Tax=Siminovitchia fordii TaxID=254759 RepID=A0ABQ4KA71_9BACI|nr:hypothetical protein [Siminovitchia fordii]GIN22628.1 hypothetical protein J1TS3_37620 [Siminovitchia fordii]
MTKINEITDQETMEVFNRLVSYEGRIIDMTISGGFHCEIGSCKVKEVKGMTLSDNTIDTIFFNTDKGNTQFDINELKEIRYDCQETFADMVLNFGGNYFYFYI